MAAGARRPWPLVCLADRQLLQARAQQLHLDLQFQDYRAGEPVAWRLAGGGA